MILPNSADQPKHQKPHYDMLRSFRELLQWRRGDAILFGEANVEPKPNMRYFGDAGERLHMMFDFMVNQHLCYALANGDGRSLAKALDATRTRPATSQ